MLTNTFYIFKYFIIILNEIPRIHTLTFGYSFIKIVTIPTYGKNPLARPTISDFSSHCWPGAYKPLSSTLLLSPFVKNLIVPLFLKKSNNNY